MLLTLKWNKNDLCHYYKKRDPYIIFSYQESQNFLLHSISLCFNCLQPSIESLWKEKKNAWLSLWNMARDSNRVTSENQTKSCSMKSLKSWENIEKRTQSTFFLVFNHVNSSHVHVNCQCFDKTVILKTTTGTIVNQKEEAERCWIYLYWIHT